MDIEYFFYVDDSTLQHLRPATSDERKWYHSLAQELGPYQKKVARQLPLYRSPARRFYQTGRVLRFVPDF